MNDLTLMMVALLGLALTAGAILRDTRHRLDALRIPATAAIREIRPVARVA